MIRGLLEAFSRLVSVFRRRTLDRDFDDEFAAHVDLLTEQKQREGLSRDEARRQAILQMGGVNATKDLHREARGFPRLERLSERIRTVGRDMKHAARSLAKARAFSFVCVASLGLGIGTVIVILVFARGLAAPRAGIEAEGLVELFVVREGPLRAQAGFSGVELWPYADFEALRNADTGLEIAGWAIDESDIETPEGVAPLSVGTMFVSSNYFSTVGVVLQGGPGFDPDADDRPAAEPRVVLGYDFWRNRLGGDPDIVGDTLTIDGVGHIVAGIAPHGFRGHMSLELARRTELFIPLARHPRLEPDRFNRDLDWVRIVGSLKPGVDMAQANATVSAVMAGLAEQYPATNEFKSASVESYFVRGARARFEVALLQAGLLGLSLMALLIVCLNLSGMMLVRSALRERELSIRQAVGASRGSLIRYLLSEAVLLAGAGGVLGAAVLFSGFAVLAWWVGQPLPAHLRPDLVVFAACAGLCLVTSLMFGLLPAIRFSRPVLISAMKDNAGAGGRRVGRIHRAAAFLQVAFVIPFLVLGGVALNQARTTLTADIGFEPDGLAAVRLDLDALGDDADGDSGFRKFRGDLDQAGGVRSVTVADGLPLDFRKRSVRVARSDQPEFVLAHSTRVGEGYLDTMGIRLSGGRDFTPADGDGAEPVVIISEPLAARLFPNGSAIGQPLRFALLGRPEEEVLTIVGVTADFVTSQMTTQRSQILLPLAQHPVPSVFLIVRGASGTEMATLPTSAFETAVREADYVHLRTPHRIVTGEALVRNSVRDFIAQSSAALMTSTVVLALAALGLGGVIGLMVATRTREIAVRMALGASRQRVLGMVLADVVKLVLPGLAGGALVTAVVRRWTFFAFYPYTAMEPVVYTVAVAIVVFVALLAGLPSARRAASVAPMAAMRSE